MIRPLPGPDGGIVSPPVRSDASPDRRPDAAADSAVGVADASPNVEDAPTQLPLAPHVNAMRTAQGAVLPIYDVHDAAYGPGKVAFVLAEGTLTALRPDESPLYARETDAEEITGGFDLDEDGWPDLALVHATTVGSCNATFVTDRHLELVSGRTGEALATWSTARDICWTFPTTAYSTMQWTSLGILWGEGTRFVSLQRQYETQGFFARYDASSASFATSYAYVFPSTSQYGSYGAARTNAYGGTAWVDESHVANGLVVPSGDGERVAFFTSARFAIYTAGPYGTAQLVRDLPFVARTDLAGRNYGLVSLDPADPERLSLIAGTDASTVHADRIDGRRESDPWGAIERHVTLVNLRTGSLRQRFYSYAHDGGDANQYQGRVVYPAAAHVRVADGPSRLAYNVFGSGRWHLHVSEPDATADAIVVDDVFLWDVRDVDGDGTDEWLVSPAEGYLPSWETTVRHWNEGERTADTIATHPGVPELLRAFRRGTATTSRGALHPVAITTDGLALHQADGTIAFVR